MRPYVVEFLGTPEAGKTTSIHKIAPILKEHGLNVSIVQESAEVIPKHIPKGSYDSNLWMHLHTLENIISVKYMGDFDIILVYRGYIDNHFWMYKLFHERKCSLEQYCSMLELHFVQEIVPDLLIALTVKGNESVSRRGGEGKLVTRSYIESYNQKFDEFYKLISIPKLKMDTTNITQDNVVSVLTDCILSNYVSKGFCLD